MCLYWQPLITMNCHFLGKRSVKVACSMEIITVYGVGLGMAKGWENLETIVFFFWQTIPFSFEETSRKINRQKQLRHFCLWPVALIYREFFMHHWSVKLIIIGGVEIMCTELQKFRMMTVKIICRNKKFKAASPLSACLLKSEVLTMAVWSLCIIEELWIMPSYSEGYNISVLMRCSVRLSTINLTDIFKKHTMPSGLP